MKEKTSKLMQKMHLAKAKLGILAATAMTATPTMVHAGSSVTSGASKGEATNLIFDIVDNVVGIFPFIGIFFVVAGGFKLIMAYRNDQPEAQAGAAKDIVIGVVFIAFRVLFWTFTPTIRNIIH